MGISPNRTENNSKINEGVPETLWKRHTSKDLDFYIEAMFQNFPTPKKIGDKKKYRNFFGTEKNPNFSNSNFRFGDFLDFRLSKNVRKNVYYLFFRVGNFVGAYHRCKRIEFFQFMKFPERFRHSFMDFWSNFLFRK